MPPFDLTGLTTRAAPHSDYLDALSQFFGVGPTGEDGASPVSMTANAPIAASALHSARANEASDQAAADPRNPVLQARSAGLAKESALDPMSDLNNFAREKQNQDALDTIHRFMNPEAVAQRAQSAQEAGGLAEVESRGKGMGAAEASTSTVGEQAANEAQARKLEQISATAGVKNQKLSQQEQQLVDSSNGIATLGGELLQKFEEKYPGIAQDPTKYGSATDMLTSKFGKGWYSLGGMTDNDPLLQDAGAIQAWGMRSLIAGRINKQMMDIINVHLPQPGFSSGANYDRLRRLIHEILPAQLEGIGRGHSFDPRNPLGNYPVR